MKYCFTFICQKGNLEIKALLLAASLKRFLKCNYEIIAVIPSPESTWGKPSTTTLTQLEDLGVKITYTPNPINTNYPIGNKISCLAVDTDADKIIFLDSDTLCCRDFEGDDRFNIDFNSKPADVSSFSKDENNWNYIYTKFGLSIPTERVLTTVSHELSLPYFNAGMIAVNNNCNFGQAWADICREIDNDPKITNKRPWLDQVGLPVTVKKLGLEYDCLDDRFNYPAHMISLNHQEPPYFCHYHWPDVIRMEPLLTQQCCEYIDEYPAIAEVMLDKSNWHHEKDNHWSLLAQSAKSIKQSASTNRQHNKKSSATSQPTGIITGIPRSGTSYLCTLLNKLDNCVAINEPKETMGPLLTQIVPHGVAMQYRVLRRKILDGVPIENKLTGGIPTEDTVANDKTETYLPTVSSDDFLLFTKNTMAYMARLDQLRLALPNAHVIACVRNPYDTIASWKTSFPHLLNADINNSRFGNLNDPFMRGIDRYFLSQITNSHDVTIRRALLWRYLADTVLEHKDQLTILRYEDLVTDPAKKMESLLSVFENNTIDIKFDTLKKSTIRSKREQLTKADFKAISSICFGAALELGYEPAF